MARQTLNRWTELGLFRLDQQKVTLADPPDSDIRDDFELISAVRRAARKRAFAPENNLDLWASEGSRAADLTRSLAWLLAQDVYRTTFKDLEQREMDQIVDSGSRLLQNDTRLNGLRFWSHFLGFVRQPEGGDIDPTVAVRDCLSEVLKPGEDLPVDSFIARLSEVIPVLDRGVWRRAVESRIRPESLPPLAAEQLSSGLSRAILCLRVDEEVVFEQRADTGSSIVLTGQSGIRSDFRFHWVRRPHKGKGNRK